MQSPLPAPIARATIAVKSGFGNVMLVEARDIRFECKPWAQYSSALHVTFVPKGKRLPRIVRLTYDPFLVVLAPGSCLDGLQQEALGAPTREGDVTVRRSLHSMCSPEWTREWREQLAPRLAAGDVTVLFDAANWDTMRAQEALL